MKKKSLFLLIISIITLIIYSIFIINFTRNNHKINSTITESIPNTSFIMADDKYCNVNLQYSLNGEVKNLKTKLSGLQHKVGDNITLYINHGHIIEQSEFIMIIFFEFFLIFMCFFAILNHKLQKNIRGIS